MSPEIGRRWWDAEQLVELPELATNGRGRPPFLLAKLVPGVATNGNTYTNINGFSFAGGRRVTKMRFWSTACLPPILRTRPIH